MKTVLLPLITLSLKHIALFLCFCYLHCNLPAGTIAGLRDDIKRATEALTKVKTSTVSVSSGCELFLRFITLTSLEQTVRKEGGREGGREGGKEKEEEEEEEEGWE